VQSARAADLKVLSAGAIEPGLKAAAAAYQRETGIEIRINFATAPQLGLSGWVVGFICSVMVLTWLLPKQYEVLRMVRELTDGEMYTERQAMAVGVMISLVAVVAILISVPYWRAIGLM